MHERRAGNYSGVTEVCQSRLYDHAFSQTVIFNFLNSFHVQSNLYIYKNSTVRPIVYFNIIVLHEFKHTTIAYYRF